MRTTLTLEPDVEAMLAEYRARNELSFKEAVNAALREGLRAVQSPRGKNSPRYATQAVDHGRPNVPNVDDIGEVLEAVEERPVR